MQQGGHAASVVKVLHVVLPRGLEVEQHRGVAPHAVQGGEVQVQAHATGQSGQMHDAIGRPANRQQHPPSIFKGIGRQDAVNGQAIDGHLHRTRAGFLGDAHALSGHGGWGCTTRDGHAQGLGNAGHGAGGAHHRAGAHTGYQLLVDFVLFCAVDGVGAKLRPVAAAIGARTHARAPVRSGQHRAGDQLNGRQAGRGCAHQLRGHGFVATANQHHRVHRLGADQFFGLHGHHVAQIHAGGGGKTLVDGHGGEIHRQTPGEHHAAFDRLDQLRGIAMAGVVSAAGVGNANHRPIQGAVGVARAFDEGFAQKQ